MEDNATPSALKGILTITGLIGGSILFAILIGKGLSLVFGF